MSQTHSSCFWVIKSIDLSRVSSDRHLKKVSGDKGYLQLNTEYHIYEISHVNEYVAHNAV